MREYQPPEDWAPETGIPYPETTEALNLYGGTEVMEFITRHSINMSVTGSMGQVLLNIRDKLQKQTRKKIDMSDSHLFAGFFTAPADAIRQGRYQEGMHYEGFFLKVKFKIVGASVALRSETFILFLNDRRVINDGYHLLDGAEPRAQSSAGQTVQ